MNKLRIWWISNPPREPFTQEVASVDEAKTMLSLLAGYDLYLGELIEANASGLNIREKVYDALKGVDPADPDSASHIMTIIYDFWPDADGYNDYTRRTIKRAYKRYLELQSTVK